MYCAKCGHNNRDGAMFCTNCGAELKKLETDAAVDTEIEKKHASPSHKNPKKNKIKKIILIVILMIALASGLLFARKFLPFFADNTVSIPSSTMEETDEETETVEATPSPTPEAESCEEVIARYSQLNTASEKNLTTYSKFVFTIYCPFNDYGTIVRSTFTNTEELYNSCLNGYEHATGTSSVYQVTEDGNVLQESSQSYDGYSIPDPVTGYAKWGDDGEWKKYTDPSDSQFSGDALGDALQEAEWTDFEVTEDTYVLTTKFKYFREAWLGSYLDNFSSLYTDYDKLLEDFDNGTITFTFDKETCDQVGMRIYDTMHTETWNTGEATFILEYDAEVTGRGTVKEEDVKVPQEVIDQAVDAE